MSTIEKAISKHQEAKGGDNEQTVPARVADELSDGDAATAVAAAPEQPAAATATDQAPAPPTNGHPHAGADPDAGSDAGYINIDVNELAEMGMVTDHRERNRINEQYRFIKRKLLKNAFGKAAHLLHHPNLILVSSASPNEGKTFTSINLAMSIALEQDKSVLLIDADVVHPSIGNVLGYQSPVGLVDYLLGDVGCISDVMYNTNVNKLKLIPSGSRHHLTNELLASDRMHALAHELATRYPDRIVIFDSPPMLGVNETQALANLVGQAVIVVEEGKTKLANIQEAVEQLDPEMAIGFVLNKSHETASKHYGYGYGYYYRN